MKLFVDAWSEKFQPENYPLEFYFSKIQELQAAEIPEDAGKQIIELLHWKDGKVRKDPEGNLLVNNESYTLSQTKPNTYEASKHKDIFCSLAFFEWLQDIKALTSFDAFKIKDFASVFKLYESIVIPSFILHVISPKIYPLYDQHVERAKRVFLAEDVLFQNKDVNINSYQEYQSFFQEKVCTCFGTNPTLEEIKKVDNALWSFGKWAKSNNKAMVKLKKPTLNHNSSYTPDEYFKREVLELLGEGNHSQLEAMKIVEAKHNVKLPNSYYDYPGSHIYRWRKQLSREKN